MDLEKISIERLREGAQMSELYYQKPLLICYSGGKDSEVIPIDSHGVIVEHKIAKTDYEITYILNGWGLKNGYVVLAIKELPFTDWGDDK